MPTENIMNLINHQYIPHNKLARSLEASYVNFGRW